jgi:thiol-disulfide isomerase/thioredoxin
MTAPLPYQSLPIKMNKRFLSIAFAVGLLGAAMGVYVGNQHTTPQTPKNAAVQQLTALTLVDSQGHSQKLSQWQGKFLLVNFWATWCAPCVQEMPELSTLQQNYAQNNVQLIGLGIDSPSNITDFAKKYQISYPLFAAGMEGTELSRQFGNLAGGLPFTVLISADGKILKSYSGRLNIEQLRSDITNLADIKR